MKNTPENKQIALEWLLQLDGLPGFPTDAKYLDLVVEGFMRIVHNKTMRERCTPEQLEGEKGDFDTKDTDMLFKLVVDRCDKFPTVAEMRRIYVECIGWERYEGSENDIRWC